MAAFRTLGGLTVPPYYGEYVLPTYISVIGIETIPGQPRTAPVISWNGWHAFLVHKIKLEPETVFMQISRVSSALAVPFTAARADFPIMPDPVAQAKESQFKTQVYALGMGAFGAGMGLGLGGHSNETSAAVSAFAKLTAQGSMNIMNASDGPGTGLWTMPGFGGGA